MGYYQGDYYRGDYYQGSPLAILGGALKLGKKVVVPALKKAVGAVKGVLSKPGAKKAVSVGTGVAITVPTAISLGKKPEEKMVEEMAAAGMLGGRRRRMNVTNPKALRRAIRRARGFAKLARKVLTFPISKPPKGRALFKKSKR